MVHPRFAPPLRMLVRGGLCLLLLLPALLLASCGGAVAESLAESRTLGDSAAVAWADATMRTLSLREKVAQSFMLAAYAKGDKKGEDRVLRMVREQGVGGLLFLQGGAKHQAALTNAYQSASKVPLLIAMDAEWGLGMRLSDGPKLPKAMAIAATGSPQMAYRLGQQIAKSMRRLGVHVNFAPVADVNSNPANPVIGVRAFGDTPGQVATYASAMMLGMQQNGVLSCAKHFPGHGSTSVDSHHALPFLEAGPDTLRRRDLPPFRNLVGAGVPMVMVAHIDAPAMGCRKGEPASLSPVVNGPWLRDSLGFRGLIVTDALNMKGVAKGLSPSEVCLRAYEAGADILLFPESVGEALDLIVRRVEDGRIPRARVDSTCRRILIAKHWAMGERAEAVELKGLPGDLKTQDDENLADDVAAESLTVLAKRRIPLTREDMASVGYVSFFGGGSPVFERTMSDYTKLVHLPVDLKRGAIAKQAKQGVRDRSHVVICVRARGYSPASRFGIPEGVLEYAAQCADRVPTSLVLFGSPYALRFFYPLDRFANVLMVYDDAPVFQRNAAQVLVGARRAFGRLPVSVPPDLQRGAGLDVDSTIRLGEASPHELGADPVLIARADSLARNAIARLAMPGMQVIAAKNGRVFYRRNFGHVSYDKGAPPVTDSTIYDLASLSKVVGTVPVIMRMYEKKKVHLRDTVGLYLPDLARRPVGGLTLEELLQHRGGLKPWYPFYHRALRNLWPASRLTRNGRKSGYVIPMGGGLFMHKHLVLAPGFYAPQQSPGYSLPISPRMWQRDGTEDSVRAIIANAELSQRGKYRYSDWSFILLQSVAERALGGPLDQLASEVLFDPLRMHHTLYAPWEEDLADHCAPSEHDIFFRHEVIQGYVNDRTAAMLGGVAGHAGLFSTASNVAVYAEMLARRGNYGGVQLFAPETVDRFTASPLDSAAGYRGYGFDKPNPAQRQRSYIGDSLSMASYGHIGFTGTIMWVDPEEHFIFVLLSNRTYPDATNLTINTMRLRGRMMNALYESVRDHARLR